MFDGVKVILFQVNILKLVLLFIDFFELPSLRMFLISSYFMALVPIKFDLKYKKLYYQIVTYNRKRKLY